MKYYLIHGVDASRKEFMLDQFAKFGIDNKDVTWLTHPNKGDIPDWVVPLLCSRPTMSKGQISFTYKHYLAIKDIVEKGLPYGVIMEDNICFKENVPKRLEQYLQQLPEGWDTLFDSDWTTYIEGPVSPDCLVYKKSNEVTQQCHGGSKLANFILVSAKGAKTMYEHFLPFHEPSDWCYNYLLKTYNMNSYWAEPGNTHHMGRPSTW